jgi:hypothetical protein
MTVKEIYKIWAPYGKKWVDWVRPVPFVQMNFYLKQYNHSEFAIPTVSYIDENTTNTAILVDLPGMESVKEGLALSGKGFRPIPIFNGTAEQNGARATVDNQSAGIALVLAANELVQIEFKDDALPAFLTDRNRLQRYKMDVSVFDNSWDVYPQDLPTAEYLLNNDIKNIVVVGRDVAKDLKKILYDYQKKGIEIYHTTRYELPKKVRIGKPFLKEKD